MPIANQLVPNAGANRSLAPQENPQYRNSGIGAVGLGFLSGDMDDDDDDDGDDDYEASRPPLQSNVKPISRPPPALSLKENIANQVQYTEKDSLSGHKQQAPVTPPPRTTARLVIPTPVQPVARPPAPAFISIPQPVPPPIRGPSMSPHPLQPPKTPITPAFARPAVPRTSDVKFSEDAILRGNSEETLLSRSTPKGAEFWRRFSVVVKDELTPSGGLQRSSWLRKNQARASRMSICIWVVSICLLLAIGGSIGIGFALTHDSPASTPKALGGSANETNGELVSSSVVGSSTSSPLHTVTGDLPPSATPPIPTLTSKGAATTAVVKRDPFIFTTDRPSDPIPAFFPHKHLTSHRRHIEYRMG